MCKSIIFALVGFLTFSYGRGSDYPNPLSDEFIVYINSIQEYWIAHRNYHEDTPIAYMEKLSGTLDNTWQLEEFTHLASEVAMPETFDAREHWPNCSSIGRMRNQGPCGSCWAYAAVQVMTDRYCIHSNGTKNFRFSVEYLISCCCTCGNGCQGGFADKAWDHWLTNGIVSGGPFESNLGCMPYTINSCQHKVNGSLVCDEVLAPNCSQKCRKGYNVPYENDFHRGKSIYTIKNDEDQIQREIYFNGPVQAVFDVFHDFMTYKSGVYKFIAGDLHGRHSVKILGWGVENGTVPYWLVANSWGSRWGTDGYFKILRGCDECGIENTTFAGIPLILD